MTPEEKNIALALELIKGLLRSWWTVVAGVCIGASLALVALRHTPEVYEAKAKIEADVEKLPREFIRRTVSDDVELRLRELRAAVLSPENLHTVIVEAFGATPNDEQALASRLTSSVQLNFSRIDRTISVAYRDQNPRRAADVTNLLAELFVHENKRIRARTAQEVRQSLEGLATDVTTEFKAIEQALTELSQKHPRELESQRLANEQKVAELRTQLEDHRRSVAAAKRRVAVLRANAARDRSSRAPSGPVASPGEVDDVDPRILQLESEIRDLLRKVTEKHPDVIAKQAEIDRLKASQSRAEPEQKPAESAETPESSDGIDAEAMWLSAAELEIERLEGDGVGVERELQRYEGYLANTPMIQRQWDELNRRYQLLRPMYEENQRKVGTAKSAEQLEAEDIGNPFVITGFAGPPSEPVFPDRIMFLGAGVAAGLFLFVGPLLARLLLRPTITSEASLRTLPVPILVAIPLIPTPETARLHKRVLRVNVGLSLLASSILCGVVALWQLNLL